MTAVIPFALATTVLMLIPGPNVALIVATSVRHGPRCGLRTVAGTASAMAVQLGALVAGLTGLLLGVRAWRAPTTAFDPASLRPGRARSLRARAFLVSLSNPKTLLFYAAFFPQFLSRGHVAGQLAVLCAIFLALAVLIDSGWAVAAGLVQPWLAGRAKLANRLSGMFLIGAGVALARRSG